MGIDVMLTSDDELQAVVGIIQRIQRVFVVDGEISNLINLLQQKGGMIGSRLLIVFLQLLYFDNPASLRKF